MEVTFEEARAHLWIETQRQWSDLAIARTKPVLFGLFTHPDGRSSDRREGQAGSQRCLVCEGATELLGCDWDRKALFVWRLPFFNAEFKK
jgi:hypothetical protein